LLKLNNKDVNSFDACQLFDCSSLKRLSFEVDLSKKKKKISMVMCYLITETNCGE